MSAKRSQKSMTTKEYEKLGRMLEAVFESGYADHGKVYRVNFIRGLFFGLGSILGGTIVVGLIIWTLSLFSEVPVIGDFVDTIQATVDQ